MTSILKVDAIQGSTTAGTVAMPAGSVVQVGTQVKVDNLNVQVTTTSFTAVGNGFIASITPKFSGSKIRVIMSFQTYSLSNYHATKLYRSVAGGAFDETLEYPISNGGNDWEAKTLVMIDTPTYTVGQTIQYQPYHAGHTSGSAVQFGWGSSGRGSACIMHCEEIKG